MMPIIENDLYKYLAVAVMLLAILFAYFKGRSAVSAMIYLGYKVGLIQPGPSGYKFSIFIRDLPFDFAVLNWPFVALYVTCRLWPNFRSARIAMWLSVAAMSLPNILLFSLAPTMVSNVFDAGQGIGIIEAMLMLPILAIIWPGPALGIFDAGFGIGFVISALTAPIPLLGLISWLVVQLFGTASNSRRKATGRP
jgi:hypothetical protein